MKYLVLKVFTLLFAGINVKVKDGPVDASHVVALGGSGDFTSIQTAIDASRGFPDKRDTIITFVD